jgi:hypothetical protein
VTTTEPAATATSAPETPRSSQPTRTTTQIRYAIFERTTSRLTRPEAQPAEQLVMRGVVEEEDRDD